MGNPDPDTMMATIDFKEYLELDARVKRLEAALRFCRDIAEEEWPFQQANPGAECALRHILRKGNETL